MLILSAIAGGLLCLTCFLFLVVHPLASIFECALSKTLSGSQKATWIVVSFFTGVFGSLAYALFVSGSPRLRSITWIGMKLGTVNLLLAIGAFTATPEVREFFSNPLAELSVETTTALADKSTEPITVEEATNPTVPDQHYVAVVNDSLEPQTDGSTEDLAGLIEQLAEEGDIVPAALEIQTIVSEPVDSPVAETHMEIVAADALTASQAVEDYRFLAEAFSDASPSDTAKTSPATQDTQTLAQSVLEPVQPTENASQIESTPSSILEPKNLVEAVNETVDTADTSLNPESTDLAAADTSLATGNKDSTSEKTADATLEPASAVDTTLESENVSTTPIVSSPVEATLPVTRPAETPKSDIVLPQAEKRNVQPVTLAKPETSPKQNRINRYRVEGYPVYEVTVPQTPTVRNRYTNQ